MYIGSCGTHCRQGLKCHSIIMPFRMMFLNALPSCSMYTVLSFQKVVYFLSYSQKRVYTLINTHFESYDLKIFLCNLRLIIWLLRQQMCIQWQSQSHTVCKIQVGSDINAFVCGIQSGHLFTFKARTHAKLRTEQFVRNIHTKYR